MLIPVDVPDVWQNDLIYSSRKPNPVKYLLTEKFERWKTSLKSFGRD